MQINDVLEKIKQKDWAPTIFYVMLFLFLLAFTLAANSYDYDLWARLIVGKHVIQTGDVPRFDFLSYTETHPWLDHEWGSSVIFYLTQHYFSHVGLVMLQVILTFLIFFTISKTIKLRGIKTITPYNFLFYMFTSFAMIQIFDQIIRCQMFTFLFFAIFLYILELSRNGKNLPLYILPVIMLFWNNMHGGCVAGLGLIALYLIGELINRKPVKKYISPLALSIFVLVINPWGLNYLPFLFQIVTMDRSMISEWSGLLTPFLKTDFIEFKIACLIFVFVETFSMIRNIRSKTFSFDATKFLVVTTTICLSIWHIKHIPLAVIAMSIFLYDDFYTLLNQLTNNCLIKFTKFKNFIAYSAVLIFVATNVNAKNFEPLVEPYRYPITIIEFIKINKLEGNLLTDFAQGSFAAYKLYPQNKIYMDGRYEEVYPNYLLENLEHFFAGQYTYDIVFINHPDTRLVILEKNAPVYPILLKSGKWVKIFEDPQRALFIKKGTEKKHYKKPSMDLNYYKKTIFNTNIDFRDKK